MMMTCAMILWPSGTRRIPQLHCLFGETRGMQEIGKLQRLLLGNGNGYLVVRQSCLLLQIGGEGGEERNPLPGKMYCPVHKFERQIGILVSGSGMLDVDLGEFRDHRTN